MSQGLQRYDDFITSEVVSGGLCAQIDPSGLIRIAMASISGRMPAFGVVVSGAVSGAAVGVMAMGTAQIPTGMANYSGFVAKPSYVGRSGHVVVVSGGFGSGGFLSGDITQLVGIVRNSGGILVQPADHRSGLESIVF